MFAFLYRLSLTFYPLVRGVFCWLPQGVQNVLKQYVRSALAEQSLTYQKGDVTSLNPAFSDGINVIGFIKGDMGLGVHARATLGALNKQGVTSCAINCSGNLLQSQTDNSSDHFIAGEPKHKANLFCVNSDTLMVYHTQRPALFSGHYNIHYAVWELANYPKAWLPAMNLVHEMWTISDFVAQAASASTSIPVFNMGIPIEFSNTEPRSRLAYGLPEDSFLFLFSYDLTSLSERKNPNAALRAFSEAFPLHKQHIGLVIKINFIASRPEHIEAIRALKETWIHDSRIIFIDQVLSYPAMINLIDNCDAYVSLHRAEGFGMGIAEAMYLGKPVIVTAYSGNMDFTRATNACLVNYSLIPVLSGQYIFEEGQVWADADTSHAAHFMRRLVEDKSYYTKVAKAGQSTIIEEYSFAAIGNKMQERLSKLGLIGSE